MHGIRNAGVILAQLNDVLMNSSLLQGKPMPANTRLVSLAEQVKSAQFLQVER
jgi:hypothetical protein